MSIPEIVEDGKTGILVPPKDVESLRNAIETLIVSPEKRRIMGEQGWEKLRKDFSVDKMVRKTEFLYDELINRVVEEERANKSKKV